MIFQQTIFIFPCFLLLFLKTQLKRKSKMHVKKTLKIITDILMFADFIFLMSHEVVRDLSAHGIFGVVLFALFILHHILNGGFYRSALRGKYSSVRILLSATAWLLFVLMILMAFSSVMMSGAVFAFSSINMTFWSRPLHTFSCSWGFLVMGFHLGIHLHSKLKKLEAAANGKKSASGKLSVVGVATKANVPTSNEKSPVIAELDSAMFAKQTRLAISSVPNNKISAKFVILQILWILIFTLGIFCIVHSKLYVYLFWMNAWKLSAPNIFVCVAEYLGMTAGMIVLSHFVMNFLQLRLAR